jgi:hypothetical protein
MVVKPLDEDAANAWQLEIARTRTDSGMEGDQSRDSFNLFPNSVWRLEPILPPPRVKFADLRFCELAYFNVQRQNSLSASKILDHLCQWNRLSPLTLGDRLKKHAFRFRICLEGLLVLAQKDGYRRPLRKLNIFKLNSTIDDPAGSDSHLRILTRAIR